MDLQQVDVVCAQARKGGLDGVEDCGAGEARLVHVVARILEVWVEDRAHGGVVVYQAKAFREDEEFVAWNVELRGRIVS